LPRTRPRTSQASLCPSQAGIWARHDGAGPNPADIVGTARTARKRRIRWLTR
jgi:hypothetical protein